MTAADPARLAYWLLKDVDKAIRDYDMIQAGDRIAVGVSGGKDSLSLLQLLDFRLKTAREKYTLCAIHIVGDSRGPGHQAHPPLVEWLKVQGCETALEPMVIPADEELPMGCGRCARHRRRSLFEAAQRLGCNKVALGHHADDLAQTTLLNLISSGKVETMAPTSVYFDGLFHLIRPLCYLPEKAIRRFSAASKHPPPPPVCPRQDHTRRQQVADLIRQAEPWCRNIRVNLLRAGSAGFEDHRNADGGEAG